MMECPKDKMMEYDSVDKRVAVKAEQLVEKVEFLRVDGMVVEGVEKLVDWKDVAVAVMMAATMDIESAEMLADELVDVLVEPMETRWAVLRGKYLAALMAELKVELMDLSRAAMKAENSALELLVVLKVVSKAFSMAATKV